MQARGSAAGSSNPLALTRETQELGGAATSVQPKAYCKPAKTLANKHQTPLTGADEGEQDGPLRHEHRLAQHRHKRDGGVHSQEPLSGELRQAGGAG